MISKKILKRLDEGMKPKNSFSKEDDEIIEEAIKRGYGYRKLYSLNVLKGKSVYQICHRMSVLRINMTEKRKQP